MMKKTHKISIVVPVYNVELYLEETIESIISQSVGFEDVTQLILVDDGSPDDSAVICKRYARKYPNNVQYIKQPNGGVSAARNNGIKHATGEYVACIDSDDKISNDYLERMLAILDENRDIPFAAARIKWFDAKTEYHATDYKFGSTRVIDLVGEPNTVTSLISSVIFRRSMIQGVYFDTDMTHNEDAKFIDEVLLACGVYRYAVVREAEFLYRKRKGETSASDTARMKATYYHSTGKYAKFLSSVGKSTKDGKIPEFIQFHALYHYRWLFTQRKKPDVLTEKEWNEYKQTIKKAISALDDRVLLQGSININLSQKLLLLHVKFHGDDKKIRRAIQDNKDLGHMLLNQLRFTINSINHSAAEHTTIDGVTSFCNPDHFNATLEVLLGDKKLSYVQQTSSAYFFDERITDNTSFSITIPAAETGRMTVRLVGNEWPREAGRQLDIAYMNTSRISMRRYDYRILKGSILLRPYNGNELRVDRFRLYKVVGREFFFFMQNLLKNKYKVQWNIPKTLAVELVRLAALISIRYKPSGIWMFSDRAISGGDNSEVLFRYVSDQKDKGIKPYYAINKDTAAYKRLKADGYNVVPFKSLRHLYLTIVSEMILPSHMDMMYLYPWFGVWHKYCGLIQYDIAHTQHGIVLNDLSNYIGRNKKNASIFLSACDWEQRYLVNGDYGYKENQVPVTGLPRYDELVDTSSETKVISLSPTWRSWLSGAQRDGKRAYSKEFSNSEYFEFYQRLINDKRVIRALQKNKYILRYYIHPNHIANKKDFTATSDQVEIMSFPYDYNKMFSESKFFITDYSNTLFDFAYLRKPVIHAQFDSGAFFSQHGSVMKQLFDYKKEGFGPVCDDYESTVSKIVEFLNNGTGLDNKYKKRIDSFFTYNDARNSERAYKFIKKRFLEDRTR